MHGRRREDRREWEEVRTGRRQTSSPLRPVGFSRSYESGSPSSRSRSRTITTAGHARRRMRKAATSYVLCWSAGEQQLIEMVNDQKGLCPRESPAPALSADNAFTSVISVGKVRADLPQTLEQPGIEILRSGLDVHRLHVLGQSRGATRLDQRTDLPQPRDHDQRNRKVVSRRGIRSGSSRKRGPGVGHLGSRGPGA